MMQATESQGYPVETFTLPYGTVENNVHTDLLDRLLGTFQTCEATRII